MARLLLFDAYFHKQHIDGIKRQAAKLESMLRQLFDQVLPEQRARLRTIRAGGPWDVEWAMAVRQQTERANELLLRLGQYRQMQQRIRELEERLPPARGWNRLRYLNPWLVTGALAATSIAVNVYRLHSAGVW